MTLTKQLEEQVTVHIYAYDPLVRNNKNLGEAMNKAITHFKRLLSLIHSRYEPQNILQVVTDSLYCPFIKTLPRQTDSFSCGLYCIAFAIGFNSSSMDGTHDITKSMHKQDRHVLYCGSNCNFKQLFQLTTSASVTAFRHEILLLVAQPLLTFCFPDDTDIDISKKSESNFITTGCSMNPNLLSTKIQLGKILATTSKPYQDSEDRGSFDVPLNAMTIDIVTPINLDETFAAVSMETCDDATIKPECLLEDLQTLNRDSKADTNHDMATATAEEIFMNEEKSEYIESISENESQLSLLFEDEMSSTINETALNLDTWDVLQELILIRQNHISTDLDVHNVQLGSLRSLKPSSLSWGLREMSFSVKDVHLIKHVFTSTLTQRKLNCYHKEYDLYRYKDWTNIFAQAISKFSNEEIRDWAVHENLLLPDIYSLDNAKVFLVLKNDEEFLYWLHNIYRQVGSDIVACLSSLQHFNDMLNSFKIWCYQLQLLYQLQNQSINDQLINSTELSHSFSESEPPSGKKGTNSTQAIYSRMHALSILQEYHYNTARNNVIRLLRADMQMKIYQWNFFLDLHNCFSENLLYHVPFGNKR